MSICCKISPYGPQAILVEFEKKISLEVNQRVVRLYQALNKAELPQILSMVPAYNSLVIKYFLTPMFEEEKSLIKKLINSHESPTKASFKIVDVPVCYSAEVALDLAEICKVKNLSEKQVIALHTAKKYHVYMLGFTPGFPYLGGLNKALAMPRKKNPRLIIPKGSVAIANEQTGIYPTSSPGGWQIIGRTPLNIFEAGSLPIINIGDKVRFYPISIEEFNSYLQSKR